MSADAVAHETGEWPVVQTDAGPVTVATADSLIARAAEWRDWAAKSADSARAQRAKVDDHQAQAGAALVDHASEWAIPAVLLPTIDQAAAFTKRVADDDQ